MKIYLKVFAALLSVPFAFANATNDVTLTTEAI
ncbi:MAG: hypothetical protein UW81_C0016G0014, partial [Candidatus Giovannonibacteria bacterium GW2011_GWC2_44_9]